MLNTPLSGHRRSVALAVAAALLTAVLCRPALAADADPEARYQTLLAAAKAGSQPVDWQALRFAYADRPSFSLQSTEYAELRKQMFLALGAQDWEKTLSVSRQMIEKNFVDPEAHLVAAICDLKLKRSDDGFRERDISNGLLRSIETGDGLTKATALTVISVDEEYAYLRLKGLRPIRQSLIKEGGHGYDLLDTKDVKGQPRPVYFQIDRVLAAEMKMFQH